MTERSDTDLLAPIMWTKSEARPIVATIDAIAKRYGGGAKLVGSVERLGCSPKDLDILLNVGGRFTAMLVVLAVIDGLREQGCLFGAKGCDRFTEDGHPNPLPTPDEHNRERGAGEQMARFGVNAR